VIELPGLTLLPGLIDAHVHLAWGAPAEGDSTLPGTDEARVTLEAGFTTVRNLGSTANADIHLARAIADNRIPGPRIIPAGVALGLPGGVCEQVFGAEAGATGDSAIAARVEALALEGAGVIKFCAGGGVIPFVADTASQELDEYSARVIVEAARKRGLNVAAHAQGSRAIRAAVEAGVSSIEHGAWIDSSAAVLMAERGTVLVPTLYRLDWLISRADTTSQTDMSHRLRRIRQGVFQRVSRAIQLGVPIAFGTDATVFPHGLNAREFTSLVEAGLSPLEAVRSATTGAARLLGLETTIGSLSAGRAADVIAVTGDPLSDVRVLERVRFVMVGGRVVKQ
jgi:imidazolonepropionase-like amidohydrolase